LRVVGYVRVSSKNAADQEASRPAQEAAIRAWCRTAGHVLVGIEGDDATSGTTSPGDRQELANGTHGRPGLATALDRVSTGAADGLVVRELDRLSRDVMVQETIFARLWLMRPATTVFSTRSAEQQNCSRTDDPDDWQRKYLRRQLGLVAELVRDMTVARLRAGKHAKAAAGGYAGGRPPYGWRGGGGQLVPVPAEQATIARMLELRQGGLSLRELAGVLAAEGHRPRPGTVRRGGQLRPRSPDWHPVTLARILQRAEKAGP
jgi:DNA invertase Pin-like site-specific DNA recombinase